MNKRKHPAPRNVPHVSASPLSRHIPSRAAVRETIESIVIAFVLAFLFRTFEAEAFVIPTGSMAPTLMGRHKDVVCDKCGYPYRVSASEEVTPDGAAKGPSYQIESCTCPMCRYTMDVGPDNLQRKAYPSYRGDRILVSKATYELSEPRRWDVVVFKYPGDAQVNYIKRLIGKPNETIRISHGQIFVGSDGTQDFRIARKPPAKLLAMLQPVFDNDYIPQILKQGWEPRWHARPSADGSMAGAWQPTDDQRAYQTDGTGAGEVWLRYRHLVPSYEQWQALLNQGGLPPGQRVKPQLISDFTAYDTGRERGKVLNGLAPDAESLGLHWVGDLALRCVLEVEADTGKVAFELVKGGREFQCHVDVATGAATLTISGDDVRQYRPTAITGVRGRGKHEIMFSNCDDELLLWVDGRVVQFDGPTSYPPLGNTQPRLRDLESPAGVASLGAAVRVSHLKLSRDIYYIAVRSRANQMISSEFPMSDFELDRLPPGYLSDPKLWSVFRSMRQVEFPLKADQFLVLGDNSAKSKDSRLWAQDGFDYYVRRELMIGKAFFIYWPHSWDTPVPFFPNFARMGFVR